jgi:hypothetical protein
MHMPHCCAWAYKGGRFFCLRSCVKVMQFDGAIAHRNSLFHAPACHLYKLSWYTWSASNSGWFNHSRCTDVTTEARTVSRHVGRTPLPRGGRRGGVRLASTCPVIHRWTLESFSVSTVRAGGLRPCARCSPAVALSSPLHRRPPAHTVSSELRWRRCTRVSA